MSPDATPRPPADEQALLLERDGGILTLTLNRPERRNAISVELAHRLAEAVEQAAAAPTWSATATSWWPPTTRSSGSRRCDRWGWHSPRTGSTWWGRSGRSDCC